MTNIVNFYRKLNKSYAFYTKLLKIYILEAIDSIILHSYFPLIRGKSHFFFQSNIFHQCDFKIECFQKHNENVREYIYDNID